MGDNTLLDGFSITGSATFPGSGIYGSGIDFMVANSVITKNLGYGAYMESCNAVFQWVNFRSNDYDSIRHTGEGYTLTVENCWIRQSGRYGVYCVDSTPIIRNSNITESDMALAGRAGIFMENPAGIPQIQNCTVAHNKFVGVWRLGGTVPKIQNSIVYHNDGPALAGFTEYNETVTYNCIEDCNSVNNNISSDPMLAYFDPNNVRIMEDSPCHDSGLTAQEHYSQFDMDNRDRVLGTAVDRGAYEIECEDTSNSYDRNADGLVNLVEFNVFSQAWLSHDPNDPMWIADPNLAEPNLTPAWNPVCNLNTASNSAYAIDLADLMDWVEDAPWLWKACWIDLEEMQVQQMMSGGDNVAEASSFGISSTIPAASIQTETLQEVLEQQSVQSEPTIEEQILSLKDSIEFLEKLWLEEPDIQKEISEEDWQKFMEAVYQNLLELQAQTVQIE
jgi:hypothetical protein